jgi:hypothetical protein
MLSDVDITVSSIKSHILLFTKIHSESFTELFIESHTTPKPFTIY